MNCRKRYLIMNFLFWNLQKDNSFFDVIYEMVKENSIGVAMFAEFPNGEQERLLRDLKKVNPSFRYLRSVVPAKVEVFSILPTSELITIRDEHRFTVKRYISRSLNRTFNLVLCHLISKTNDPDAESNQAEEVRYVVKAIGELEEAEGNCLTIVCGDLNMNPFEEGMVGSSCFNAVMDKTIAMSLRRTVNERDFKMFYNPMWGLLGDNGRSIVSGTYFYNPHRHVQYFWNMFDQVLIRPEVIPYFSDRYLRILTGTKSMSLLTVNHTMRTIYSDHLPIKFAIKTKK